MNKDARCSCGRDTYSKGKCRRCYQREYQQRPGVKEKMREHQRKYRQRPGVKERTKERRVERSVCLMVRHEKSMAEVRGDKESIFTDDDFLENKMGIRCRGNINKEAN